MIKDDLAYIDHILDCIRKINEFSKGLSLKEFKSNELVQDAIIRNIEIIGEASKKFSKGTKQTYYKIPWKEIAGPLAIPSVPIFFTSVNRILCIFFIDLRTPNKLDLIC